MVGFYFINYFTSYGYALKLKLSGLKICEKLFLFVKVFFYNIYPVIIGMDTSFGFILIFLRGCGIYFISSFRRMESKLLLALLEKHNWSSKTDFFKEGLNIYQTIGLFLWIYMRNLSKQNKIKGNFLKYNL